MKTIVTGGSGFIGSHLVKRLLDEGRDVVVVDDFSRGTKQNLADLNIQVECRNSDLRDYQQVAKSLADADAVFHFAACVGSVEYLHGDQQAELKTLQSNLAIDTNIFRKCMELNVKKIVYASSVSVYPIDLQQKSGTTFSEEDLKYYNPEGGYGWAKLLGEIQLAWLKNSKIGIARIFNIYGPNNALGKTSQVIPSLICKAIDYSQKDFVVWGDGTQSRCFTYISDCIDALMKLEEKASNPPLTVNIGSDYTITVAEIVQEIVKISRKKIDVKYDLSKPVGPISRTANISRAEKLLQWRPKVKLEEGLKQTYRWVEKRIAR